MTDIIIVQNSLKTCLKFRVDYINKLISKGFSVEIIAPMDCSYSEQYFLNLGVKLKCFPQKEGFWGLLKYLLTFNVYMLVGFLKCRESIFVTHFLVTFVQTLPAQLLIRSKKILSIEGLGSFFSNKPNAIKILKALIQLSGSHLAFCNNNERVLLGKSTDFITGGIGINLDKYKPNKSIIKDNSKLNVIFVGRLIADKGARDAIEVLRLSVKDNMPVKMTFIGETYKNNPSSLSDSEIKDYTNEFGDKVDFVGYSSDVNKFYNLADVLLLPSQREGFPVCVMEASAMGIPTLCYNVPGCSDAIEQGSNGFLSPLNDYQDLYSNLKMIWHAKKTGELRLSCRKYSKDNFDVSKKSSEFIDFILS
ncbi:TPA: glycosyltransferase [Vibrio parahaemolyticus]|nr:glycosyltransferase [Vibrio parahaemolyticus]